MKEITTVRQKELNARKRMLLLSQPPKVFQHEAEEAAPGKQHVVNKRVKNIDRGEYDCGESTTYIAGVETTSHRFHFGASAYLLE
eukprot:102133-Prorocentrum_lima.AAC.1